MLAVTALCATAQENTPTRLPEWKTRNSNMETVETFNRGFWLAADLSGGYSLRFSNPEVGYAEMDVSGGYRFSGYLRLGLGLGARWYSSGENKLRRSSMRWGMPVYATARGNFIGDEYRTTVPCWSVDVGASVRDGFMLRPSVGLRIGMPRKAFTLALSYMLQNQRGLDYRYINPRPSPRKVNRAVSFIGLRIGFEY